MTDNITEKDTVHGDKITVRIIRQKKVRLF